jgi:hypothetical protein
MKIMNKYLKALPFIVAFPLLTLLTGCDSDDDSSSQPQLPKDGTVIEVTVTPQKSSVLVGEPQQMVAVAKYDNGAESDVSDSAMWEIAGDPTVAEISASGLLTGNNDGEIVITAQKDGVNSGMAQVIVCDDLAGPCIDIFDIGTGKLFTNSPSVDYVKRVDGRKNGTSTEDSTNGPVGVFATFVWGLSSDLCDTYNTHSVGGRTNWQLPSREELKTELFGAFDFDEFGNMFTARGWPITNKYWTSYHNGIGYYDAVSLIDGESVGHDPKANLYVSCVSNP